MNYTPIAIIITLVVVLWTIGYAIASTGGGNDSKPAPKLTEFEIVDAVTVRVNRPSDGTTGELTLSKGTRIYVVTEAPSGGTVAASEAFKPEGL